MAAAQPRRDTGTDQQPEHEQHRRNRDGTEYEHHLRRPMLAPNPTPDAAKLAGPPRSRSLDYAVAGTGAEGGPPSFDFLAQTCRYGSPTLGFDADRPECEPVSVDMRTSLCPVGIKSAGKGFARARDRAAFCPRDRPSAAAETGDSAPACANVAANRGFFQRPQETGSLCQRRSEFALEPAV
jgi:hypothetical protein